jgi:hypothetical protein
MGVSVSLTFSLSLVLIELISPVQFLPTADRSYVLVLYSCCCICKA